MDGCLIALGLFAVLVVYLLQQVPGPAWLLVAFAAGLLLVAGYFKSVTQRRRAAEVERSARESAEAERERAQRAILEMRSQEREQRERRERQREQLERDRREREQLERDQRAARALEEAAVHLASTTPLPQLWWEDLARVREHHPDAEVRLAAQAEEAEREAAFERMQRD